MELKYNTLLAYLKMQQLFCENFNSFASVFFLNAWRNVLQPTAAIFNITS